MSVGQFGRFKIIREIGRGSMGIVYEAQDSQLGRVVALKTLSLTHGLDGVAKRQAIERFQREGRGVAGLRHANIAQIYDVGEEQGRQYIVMEYCEGVSLRDIIQFENSLNDARVKRIVEQLLDALETAHAKGIVHRDVKPENIIIGKSDILKLTDFGVAKFMGDGRLTQTGQALGSPAYMAPEQVLGKPVDQRTDLFAVGIIVYECLTGSKPFQGTSLTEITHKIAYDNPAPLPTHLSIWQAFFDRALAKDPNQRFANAPQMLQALKSGASSSSSTLMGNMQPLQQSPNIQPGVPYPGASRPSPGMQQATIQQAQQTQFVQATPPLPPTGAYKICPQCNTACDPAAVFCTVCGRQFQHQFTPQPNQTTFVNQPGQFQGNQFYAQGQNYPPLAKSKTGAGLLGIFLGGLGVHRFYLGYFGIGIAQLLLSTILLLPTYGFSWVVAGIWGFVEGILILTGGISEDADGRPLKP